MFLITVAKNVQNAPLCMDTGTKSQTPVLAFVVLVPITTLNYTGYARYSSYHSGMVGSVIINC